MESLRIEDLDLRPRLLSDFIGQTDVIDSLSVALSAAKIREESLDHTLFYGPPGLGKTTLSMIIAQEMGVGIKITSGPSIEKLGDIVAILTSLNDGDVLFIDEIHRLPKVVEETLYPAMEDRAIDVIIGKGPTAKSLRLELPRFTLVGATTKSGALSSPLRHRFGLTFRLQYYDLDALMRVVVRSAAIMELELGEKLAYEVASRSRGTPRVANRNMRRIRDYLQVDEKKLLDQELLDSAFNNLGIDSYGLEQEDRRYLSILAELFGGGPVGLSTIAAAMSEDKQTIEEVIEPFLIQLGKIKRTPKGRVLVSTLSQ